MPRLSVDSIRVLALEKPSWQHIQAASLSMTAGVGDIDVLAGKQRRLKCIRAFPRRMSQVLTISLSVQHYHYLPSRTQPALHTHTPSFLPRFGRKSPHESPYPPNAGLLLTPFQYGRRDESGELPACMCTVCQLRREIQRWRTKHRLDTILPTVLPPGMEQVANSAVQA